jgi:hypothetical protein
MLFPSAQELRRDTSGRGEFNRNGRGSATLLWRVLQGKVRKGGHAHLARDITITLATKIVVASSRCTVSNWNNYKNLGRYHTCLQSN